MTYLSLNPYILWELEQLPDEYKKTWKIVCLGLNVFGPWVKRSTVLSCLPRHRL